MHTKKTILIMLNLHELHLSISGVKLLLWLQLWNQICLNFRCGTPNGPKLLKRFVYSCNFIWLIYLYNINLQLHASKVTNYAVEFMVKLTCKSL